MEVKLEKRYPLGVDQTTAWTLLCDIRAVAACMPGAAITEQLGENAYKGSVKVKVGPAVAQFGGTVDVVGRDDAQHSLTLRGKGADKGGSSASMDLQALIEPAGDSDSVLVGNAAVIVNGKFAQFGGRMMVQVSEMLLEQFIANFRTTAQAMVAPAAAPAAAVDAAPDASAPPAATPAPASAAAPVAAKEINGLAIVWMLIRQWFSGLFGARRGRT